MGRRFGQHFLTRESITRRIAAAVCGADAPTIVEIGPGKGALTRHLVECGRPVNAVEVDPYLVHYLRQKFRDFSNLNVVDADVLKTDLSQWGPASVGGNLPYYITSPIIDRVFGMGSNWTQAVFLVQAEVAERLAAAPGSRDYGYASVHAQVHSHVEILFPVPAVAFTPPPKVESAVIRLTPRDCFAAFGLARPTGFLSFASLAFHQKRKTLRNNLRGAYPEIDRRPEAPQRAEQLGVPELIALYNALAPA